MWFVSDTQTAGRGRRGRAWETLDGNLAASLIVPHMRQLQTVGLLSYLCAVAVAQTLERFCAKERIQLKWPNDILLDERKVAGILIETTLPIASTLPVVVCGIGINCTQAPAQTLFPAASLKQAGLDLPPHQVFSGLADCMAALLEQWQDGQNFSYLRQAWLERAYGLGSPIRIQRHDGMVNGIFETIDEHGCLIMRSSEGARFSITSGDMM